MSTMYQMVSANDLQHKYPGIKDEKCIYVHLASGFGLDGQLYDLRTYPEVDKAWKEEYDKAVDAAKRAGYYNGLQEGMDRSWVYVNKLVNIHRDYRKEIFDLEDIGAILKTNSCKEIVAKIDKFEKDKKDITKRLKDLVDEAGASVIFDCLYEITHPQLYKDSKEEQ